MSKEEFIKQRCEIDKITEEEFEKRYRVVKCNCGQSYCKGYRCLDLDGLLKENQELEQENKQLKENNMSMQEEMARTWEKADLYKDVIEEVREYINSKVISNGEIIDQLRKIEVKELLQILDKEKGGE